MQLFHAVYVLMLPAVLLYKSCSTDCISALAMEVVDLGGCLQEVRVKEMTLVNVAQDLGDGKRNERFVNLLIWYTARISLLVEA